jgi:tetratricopeptide (TPR) repeat protein
MCLEGAPGLAPIWNEETRRAIRTAHAVDAGADAGDAGDLPLLGELVIARVDELAAALAAAVRETCEARGRGEIDDAALDSIGDCLAGVRAALVEVLPLARHGREDASTELVLALAVGPASRLEGCLAAALSSGPDRGSAEELLARGRAEAARGEPGEALAFLERAAALYAEAGDRLGRMLVALEMGHVAAAAGMADAASQMYSKAARHCRAAAAESPPRREAALATLDAVAAAFVVALGPEHPHTRALVDAREICAGD